MSVGDTITGAFNFIDKNKETIKDAITFAGDIGLINKTKVEAETKKIQDAAVNTFSGTVLKSYTPYIIVGAIGVVFLIFAIRK